MELWINPELKFELLQLEALTPAAISQHYHYKVTVLQPMDIDPTDCVGQFVQIRCSNQSIPGVIVATQQMTGSERPHFQINLASPLEALAQQPQSKVFVRQTLKEVVQSLLSGQVAYQWQVEHQFLPEDFVQYKQNDLDFLQRILAERGIFWYFLCSGKLLITDHFSHASVHHCHFVEKNNLCPADATWLTGMVLHQQLLAESVVLKDCDLYQVDAEREWQQRNYTAVKGYGQCYHFADHGLLPTSGEYTSLIRQQAIDCQREHYRAQSPCSDIQLGDVIHLKQHPEPSWNQAYRVIAIEHRLDARNEHSSDVDYSNELKLMALQTNYRPQVPQVAKELALLANVIGTAGGIAHLDEKGCYAIKFVFSNNDDAIISGVPLNQAYVGPNSGIHFPLPANTLVLVGFVYGVLTRPVILGVVPTEQQPGPVTHKNPQQSVIQSLLKQNLTFTEGKQLQSIQLENKPLQQSISLVKDKHQQRWQLQDTNGKLRLKSERAFTVQAGGEASLKIQQDSLWQVGKNLSLMAPTKDIKLTTQGVMSFKIQKSWHLQSQQMNFSGHDLKIQHQANGEWFVEQGDMSLSVEQGGLQMKSQAMYLSSLSNRSLTIETPKAKIKISSQGEITFTANKISLIADKLLTTARSMQKGPK